VTGLTRRAILAQGGLLIGFSLIRPLRAQEAVDEPQAETEFGDYFDSIEDNPQLDSWIRISDEGEITVFTGKVELGQGIKTALRQVAAEELGVDPMAIELVTADTGRTPNEGTTSGSQSMEDSGTAILHAAAQVRAILTQWAAEATGADAGALRVEGGAVVAPDGGRIGYGELVRGRDFAVPVDPNVMLKDPSEYSVMGRALPRVDIPAKLVGAPSYVHDFRPEGVLHARVLRPPSYDAELVALDPGPAEAMPGVVAVIRDGRFLAVVAERQFQAVAALRVLAAHAEWTETGELPGDEGIFDLLLELDADDEIDHETGGEPPPADAVTVEATYLRPYQMHGAIGPSCAVALWEDERLTLWSHSQNVFALRDSVADMLRIPAEQVRSIHMEGAGCYGHNGADDVGGDAALIARALPGRPIRVLWMREDEHAWEPYGSAMVTRARGSVADGRIVGWDYEVWSTPHSTRPDEAGGLMPAWHIEDSRVLPRPTAIPLPTGGGNRNAIPLYDLPNARVTSHFIAQMPLRSSALRALGGYMNVFSLESFMDELAAVAGVDPVEFRLRHMENERARDVIALAAERFDWDAALAPGRGKGFGFAQYKNLAAYCAVAVEAEVDRNTGRITVHRAVAANDSGKIVNPNGIVWQIEGGILQSTSWTLFEEVRFDAVRVTSRDWASYPIMRFDAAPRAVEVHLIDRPGQPFLGTGEASQGPTAAAIANAVADATGLRLRRLPLSPARVRAAIGV
jgi:nicotinate dehydrogenase subunit B